jgi:hypothetical protein
MSLTYSPFEMTTFSHFSRDIKLILICLHIQYRVAAKSNSNVDEPGAFPSREFLRALVVGKQVTFETRSVKSIFLKEFIPFTASY